MTFAFRILILCFVFIVIFKSSSCILLSLQCLNWLSLFWFQLWYDLIGVVYSNLINPNSRWTSFNSRTAPVHIYSRTAFTLHTALKLNETSYQTFHLLIPFMLNKNMGVFKPAFRLLHIRLFGFLHHLIQLTETSSSSLPNWVKHKLIIIVLRPGPHWSRYKVSQRRSEKL